MRVCQKTACPLRNLFYEDFKPLSNKRAEPSLRYLEHQKNNSRKNGNTHKPVCKYAVDNVVNGSFPRFYFSLFYLFNNTVYVCKAFSVRGLYTFFIRIINVRNSKGSLLFLALCIQRGFYNGVKSVIAALDGRSEKNRTSKLCR